MLKVQSDSRQIPSVETYTADKKYNDLLYGVLQEMSYYEKINGVTTRYVDKRNIRFEPLGERIGLKRAAASRKFKNLIELGLIEYIEAEKRYKLIYLDKSVASLVPFKTLAKLNNTLNQNSISLFVYLLKRYIANGEKEFSPTMSQMKQFCGISDSSSSNNVVINDILEVLSLLGLVEYELRQLDVNSRAIYVTRVNNVIKSA